jgi:hypothetical protein
LRYDDEIIAKLGRLDKKVKDLRKEKSAVQFSSINEKYWMKDSRIFWHQQPLKGDFQPLI